MKNYYFKTDMVDYKNKILDTLDKALNDLSSEDFDILIQIIQEYINGKDYISIREEKDK